VTVLVIVAAAVLCELAFAVLVGKTISKLERVEQSPLLPRQGRPAPQSVQARPQHRRASGAGGALRVVR